MFINNILKVKFIRCNINTNYMKTILKCAFFINLFVSFSVLNAATIPLADALQQKKITCNFKGNEKSTHYLEPILMEITNLGNAPISLQIKSGDMFIPTDATYQNIVTTENKLIALKANSKLTVPLKGMCTESSNSSGNGKTIYTYQPNTNEKLIKLASFIAEHKYQTATAQHAVWALMNNEDVNNIYGADSTEERQLRKCVATITGKTFEVISKDYKTNYYAPPKQKVGGKFEYNIVVPKDVQIAMFNTNGILVRELFNQKNVAAGNHQFSFEYDASVYTEDVYYFKLIAANNVVVSTKWDAKSMRDKFKQKIQNRN